MGYVLLVLALVFNACANILLKVGSSQFAALGQEGIVRAVATNYALLGGLALFALNVAFYAMALSRIPLSVGYPVMTAGGLLIITAVSVLYLHEALSLWQGIGIVFLVIGMVLVVSSSR